jgi:hypothetical protein
MNPDSDRSNFNRPTLCGGQTYSYGQCEPLVGNDGQKNLIALINNQDHSRGLVCCLP